MDMCTQWKRTNAVHAANDRQVSIVNTNNTDDPSATAPKSSKAAQALFNEKKAAEEEKINADERTVTGKSTNLSEDFKKRADETSLMQNLGRTPWSDYGALDQLEKDNGGKKADAARPHKATGNVTTDSLAPTKRKIVPPPRTVAC
jgi:cobalamin biosynthesis protein CobT